MVLGFGGGNIGMTKEEYNTTNMKHDHQKVVEQPRDCPGDGKVQMTLEQFTKWLKKFDKDGDGQISRDELRWAIRATGVWFSRHKAKRGIQFADTDGDGFINENEIKNLVEFAETQMGVRIVAY